MTYRLLVNDRKRVVARMEQLAGEKPVYTRMPRCAYILRGIVVEKDNTIVTEEGADRDLLKKLISEGLVEAPEGGTEPETEEVVELREETEAPEDNSTVSPGTEEDVPAAREREVELIKPSISFPLEQHRAESIRNLVFTIYSRGKLISKSTGGSFFASEELVERIRSCNGFTRPEKVIEMIHEEGTGALKGLSFEEGKVKFDGFPETSDPVVVRAWTVLAAAINRSAIKQSQVHATVVDAVNEKFSFRTWLTRLGMNGPELKTERNVLYRNLSGHTAFRTPKDEEKWKARQVAKRDALRALPQAESENQSGAEN